MKKTLLLLLSISINIPIQAQELSDILESEIPNTTEYVSATFKGTRIINGHSIENRKKGILEFLISHRFGKISDGEEQFFGIDESNIRLALEYGLTNDIMIGLGRSSFEKTYDGFIKYKLLKQSKGEKTFPISVSLFGSVARKTLKDYLPENEPSFNERLFYTTQILIARKFSESFSFQLTPSYIHRNLVATTDDPHDIFALGAGMRLKLNKRMSINSEYYHTFNPLESKDVENVFSIGLDIETGGHIFQLVLSNANTMIEKAFITETTDNFFKGDIHFGFNISRAFHLQKHKTKILLTDEEKNYDTLEN
jgi:hypothetical protein